MALVIALYISQSTLDIKKVSYWKTLYFVHVRKVINSYVAIVSQNIIYTLVLDLFQRLYSGPLLCSKLWRKILPFCTELVPS